MEYSLIKKIILNRYPNEQIKARIGSPTILEQIVMCLLVLLRSFSLCQRIKGGINRKLSGWVDGYVFGAFVFLIISLFYFSQNGFLLLPVIYLLFEMLVTTLAVFHVDRYKRNHRVRSLTRSLLLLFIGYFELILGFSFVFLIKNNIAYANCGNVVETPLDALYYSVVTITTLGYGDIVPINKSGRICVIAETLAGICVLVYGLSFFMSQIKTGNEPHKNTMGKVKPKDSN